jgi:hypothetical protein
LKAALRKGATRTVQALLKLIGKLIRSFAPQMWPIISDMPDTPDDPHHAENALATSSRMEHL